MNEENIDPVPEDEDGTTEDNIQGTEKTMAERALEVGRDGAYLEIDAQDLVAAYRKGDLQKAKIVVIKAARIEMSEPRDIDALQKLVAHTVTCLTGMEDKTFDVTGMSDEQASFHAVRSALSNGLKQFPQ